MERKKMRNAYVRIADTYELGVGHWPCGTDPIFSIVHDFLKAFPSQGPVDLCFWMWCFYSVVMFIIDKFGNYFLKLNNNDIWIWLRDLIDHVCCLVIKRSSIAWVIHYDKCTILLSTLAVQHRVKLSKADVQEASSRAPACRHWGSSNRVRSNISVVSARAMPVLIAKRPSAAHKEGLRVLTTPLTKNWPTITNGSLPESSLGGVQCTRPAPLAKEDALGSSGMHWAALGCSGLLWAALGCSGLLWTALGCSGMLHWFP